MRTKFGFDITSGNLGWNGHFFLPRPDADRRGLAATMLLSRGARALTVAKPALGPHLTALAIGAGRRRGAQTALNAERLGRRTPSAVLCT